MDGTDDKLMRSRAGPAKAGHYVRIAIPIAAWLVLMWAGVASAETMAWNIQGERREALVFAPSTPPAGGRSPLVLAFHGRGDEVHSFQLVLLQRAWPDALVVYFQGLEGGANGLTGWQVECGQDHDRDLKLVDAALATLREKYRVDEDRIYATGYSNGAMFTYLLWAERPRVFAAFATVAGRLRPSVQPAQPRPLLHVAGERDMQVAFADQKEAMATAVRVNGVRGATAPCGDGCTLYGGGTPAPVMTWIHPGGHVYPRSASERIAAFFRGHPRRM